MLGFLFFEPAYTVGANLAVGGWPRGLEGLRSLRFRLGPVQVTTMGLNHPQGGIGYRFQEDGQALVFVTDNELRGPGPYGLDDYARFCQSAQVLVHDAQYLPQEMERRQGWGRSDWASVVELTRKAGVGRLVLTHHDPGRTDRQVDEIVAQACQAAGPGLTVEAAYKDLCLEVTP